MKYLPYENLTYKTHLSKDEIIKRLSEEIQPSHWLLKRRFSFNGKYKSYEGLINEDSFKISRVIIDYQNSFAPQIKGKIEEVNDSHNSKKTLIHIKMRLYPLIVIFFGVFMTLGGLIFMTIFAREIQNPSISNLPFFVSPLLIIIFLVAVCRAFHSEANKSKEFFEKIFEIKKINNKKI
ncbi:hypothetical protein ACE193_20230 [Bernardetia sp. OM2101]|uniref:hypothetical protein n=1 Tax=Bernardetia sp. OM2101 TaxID=3344876 RepID=UPI0035CE93D4